MQNWSTKDIPKQSGKLAIVTGATGGLGYDTALALAIAGAEVIVAGRNATKGEAAVKKILAHEPAGKVRFEMLDLASLKQIESFCQKLTAEDRPVDILVNNAGVWRGQPDKKQQMVLKCKSAPTTLAISP